MNKNEPIYRWTSKGAGMWSKIVGRGKTLRFTDTEGGANVGLLLYNAHERSERYNMPDTLKGQHIFYLTSPFCLHSDMGRLMASMTQDTAGWHDTVCGTSDNALVEAKYGVKDFQKYRNQCLRSGRECFQVELGKWGLGTRDLVPNLNLFSKVVTDDDGDLKYVEGASAAGSVVELRLEMDTLVVFNTCPHPLDPATTWAPKPVTLEVLAAADEPAEDDPCFQSRPENLRAFENTRDYNLLRF